MTPPEQYVVERTAGAFPLSDISRDRRLLSPGVLGFAADLVALMLVLAVAGSVSGALQPHLLVFALIAAGSGIRSAGSGIDLNVGALDDVGCLSKRIVVAYALTAALTTLVPVGEGRILLAGAAASLPALFLGRVVAYRIYRLRARSGAIRNTIVVGADDRATRMMQGAVEDADYGLKVVAAIPVTDEPAPGDVRRLGTILDLPDIAQSRSAQVVIVGPDVEETPALVESLRALLADGADVWVVPRFADVGADMPVQHIASVPLLRLLPPAERRFGWGVKRAIDVAVSGTALLLAAPFMAVIAAAVKLESEGPILFSQERVGLGGRTFKILKFRTMALCSELRSQTEWAADAQRVTRVGNILRTTGLDELPQLFNVLRGDLTLVGPRPERPIFVRVFDEMYPHYSDRHRVPAGISGWAQVHGLRGDTSIEDRAHFDNYYIDRWSLATDMKIALLTFRTFLPKYRGKTVGDSTVITESKESKEEKVAV